MRHFYKDEKHGDVEFTSKYENYPTYKCTANQITIVSKKPDVMSDEKRLKQEIADDINKHSHCGRGDEA